MNDKDRNTDHLPQGIFVATTVALILAKVIVFGWQTALPEKRRGVGGADAPLQNTTRRAGTPLAARPKPARASSMGLPKYTGASPVTRSEHTDTLPTALSERAEAPLTALPGRFW